MHFRHDNRMTEAERARCEWAGSDPLMVDYHDREWGVPSHEDRHLFEMLTLEGAQAGLSWTTILRKREGYRKAFAGFDVPRVARFDDQRVERLLEDPRIVRNRLKVESTVNNAASLRELRGEFGSFDAYLWRFVDEAPIQGRRRRLADLPSETPVSRELSRDLKKRGFRFVGPTVCYAFMQAVGLVNDHVTGCFRDAELGGSPDGR
jgi:DNA-3-methyladenine glycosylase I